MNRTGGPYLADPGDHSGQYWSMDGVQREPPDTIINFNSPPEGQPGLWCQWVPSDDGKHIEWDGGEKFYEATEWMAYLVDHFLRPGAIASLDLEGSIRQDSRFRHFTFDHIVNGIIDAQGEDPDDRWRLVVKDNEVSEQTARLTWD